MAENGIINLKIAEKMKQMAGFRNLLAYVYGKLDYNKLYQVLTEEAESINQFLNAIKIKIKI